MMKNIGLTFKLIANLRRNYAERVGIISSEQAWYLREKYLGMRKEDNIG